ncbi:MAG TPA: hypothetical protein VM243_15490 [Phycisphaerae bacterium]|nr:hypothetical protein [Phycisphaerae bacterium]
MFLPLAEIDWNSVLVNEPAVLIVCALWVVVGLIVLAAIIAVQWRKVQIAKENAALKQQMIERGFTAEQIVNVIQAGAPERRPGQAPQAAQRTPAGACCPDPVAH